MSDTSSASALPELSDSHVRLREVRLSDAASLSTLFARTEVSEHLSPPPDSIDAFAEWITLSLRRREDGRSACYAVLDANGRVGGLFMCLRVTKDAPDAEIGFALSPELWGTGIFGRAASLYIDALFARWSISRLVGRTLARNHRGLGAMRKLGATIIEQIVREGEAEFVWAIRRDVWPRRSARRSAGT